MSGHLDLEGFLRTDPRDVGCGEATEIMHVYVEAFLTDRAEAERRYPGVAVHLRECGPCGTDFDGLRALLQTETPS